VRWFTLIKKHEIEIKLTELEEKENDEQEEN